MGIYTEKRSALAALIVCAGFAAWAQPQITGVPEFAAFASAAPAFSESLNNADVEAVEAQLDQLNLDDHYIHAKLFRMAMQLSAVGDQFAVDAESAGMLTELMTSRIFDANDVRTRALIWADTWVDSALPEDLQEAQGLLGESRQLDAALAADLAPYAQALASMDIPAVLGIELEPVDRPIERGANVGVIVRIYNAGQEAATDVELVLLLNEELSIGELRVDLPDIPPDETLEHKLLLGIPFNGPNNAVIQVEVRADNADPASTYTAFPLVAP